MNFCKCENCDIRVCSDCITENNLLYLCPECFVKIIISKLSKCVLIKIKDFINKEIK